MGIADIDRELDQAKNSGAVRDIIIPPCPELLTALRKEVALADPDPGEIARIAASDVAMAASLLRRTTWRASGPVKNDHSSPAGERSMRSHSPG